MASDRTAVEAAEICLKRPDAGLAPIVPFRSATQSAEEMEMIDVDFCGKTV
jgi:hypothetical protein